MFRVLLLLLLLLPMMLVLVMLVMVFLELVVFCCAGSITITANQTIERRWSMADDDALENRMG